MTVTAHSRHPYARPRNPIRRPVSLMVLTIATFGSLATTLVSAQEHAYTDEFSAEAFGREGDSNGVSRGSARIMLRPPVAQRPKMGFMGHMMSGWGMMVDRVIPGTTSARLGLEPGDVVMKINGKQVTCAQRYRELLWEAVNVYGGRLSLKVDNVRARQGLPAPRYAHVTGWLEFGGHYASRSSISTEL